jgi:YVTN family beta-propeller protein
MIHWSRTLRKAKKSPRRNLPALEQLEGRLLLDASPASPIQHIIYVVKENRTFDQVFGSLGQGNGDPSLNLFGQESAPNQRALQRTFLTLDNFYADAEVSADGWNWLTGGLANTYVQKAYAEVHRNGNLNRRYDFEGGNLATSPGPDPQDAFIWDKLSDAGISYRNYGFRVRYGHMASTEPRLAANTDMNFQGFDLTKPDSVLDLIVTGVNQPTRIAEWLKEFNNYVATGTLPTVEFVRLPNDHNAGNSPGFPTPRAYMADNDLALGKLVDAVSHSPYWKSTLILVTEDDAQNGPDHVDAHRTIAQVISPYTQTGQVDSTFYSTVSMLRTIEQIVGIPPMTQFDAAATSFLGAFTEHANFTPYRFIVPTQNVYEKNPAPNPLAVTQVMSQLATGPFAKEDLMDPQELNQQIWQSVKGDTPMPAPVMGFRGLFHGLLDQPDDVLHAGPQGDGTGVTTQGWLLTPAGQQVQLGDRPMGIALSPDGKTILVSNDGSSAIESLMVIDRASGDIVQTINYPVPEALWIGLAFSPDGTHAYASAGHDNVLTLTGWVTLGEKIRVYEVAGQQLTETAPIVVPLPIGPNGRPVNLYPAGLSVSPDGQKLFLADNVGDSVSVIDLTTGTVTATIAVGHNPYTTLVSKDGKTVYVGNWGSTTISVVDVSGATPTVTQTVQVGTHPTAMLLNPVNNELYVANADSDTISVLDTTTNPQVGQTYLYPAVASDNDTDTWNFDLPVHPYGMGVDGPSGTVAWVPTPDEVGTFSVLLRVTDSRGSIALQPYQITVTPADTAPVITSTPITTGTVNVAYQYLVHAQDAEKDALTFTLVSPPTGMSLTPLSAQNTGQITWTPATAGSYSITVQVADAHNTVTQTYTLTIASTGSNGTPTITSNPRATIALGQTYYYQVIGGDSDNDPLTYSLVTAPPNMGISAQTAFNAAMISWTPTASMIVNGVNTFNVTVQVSDGRGGTNQQPFVITVTDQAANQKPVISSSPPLVATVGTMYSYNLTGYSPVNDPLYWNLVSGPWGLSVDPNLGTLRWLPLASQVGNQTVTVNLLDAYGGKATQTWTIVVHGAGLPPVITSTPPLNAVFGQLYTYAVQASDADGDPLSYSSIGYPPVGSFSTTTPNLFTFTPGYSSSSPTIVVSDGNGNTATQPRRMPVTAC